MQKTALQEAVEVFRQLNPDNQERLMAMARVAQAAQNNIRHTTDAGAGEEPHQPSGTLP